MTQLNVKDLAQQGVSLIPSTDSRFAAYATALLGGAGGAVQAVEPFSVILWNQSGSDILAYSLRWLWTDASGRTTFHDVFYHNLNMPTNSYYRVPAGRMAFVSLFFAVVGPPGPLELTSAQMKRLSAMASQTAITVSLDGVLFAGGSYVGPDETRGYSQAVALTSDETAFMQQILTMHTSGQTDSDVFAWVQGIASALPATGAGGIASLDYSLAQRRLVAHVLLDLYQKYGAARAFSYASQQVSAPGQTIVKVQ